MFLAEAHIERKGNVVVFTVGIFVSQELKINKVLLIIINNLNT